MSTFLYLYICITFSSIQVLLIHLFLKFSWALFNHYIAVINMQPIDFGYSVKNIPTHSKSSYFYRLIKKVKVLKRMRWKALFFDKDQANSNTNVNSNSQNQRINTFNLNFMKSWRKIMKKIIHENVTKKYKKANMSLPKRINRDAKKKQKPLMSLIKLIPWQSKNVL